MENELKEEQSTSYVSTNLVTIVGIGASAGGLEALEAFFANVPKEPGCAFIVVQHLPADRKSLMPEILTRHTRLQAHEAQDGEAIVPDRIYLPPPGHFVRLQQGAIALGKIPATELNSWPINMLFTSLARELGDRAIVVILSGSGSDGMRGCEAVRDRNGLVLVQDRKTAAFDGMPRSAALVADLILPPQELAASVLAYARRDPEAHTPVDGATSSDVADETRFAAILDIVSNRYRVSFADYKSEMIHRRIERRANLQGHTGLDGYRDLLGSDDLELSRLFKDLLIGVTGFFRDEHVFVRLAEMALPKLVANVATGSPFRCWVAGCATGEEAYSMAILVYEALAAAGKPINFNVFATDVFEPALEIASRGNYEPGQVSSMSMERLSRFFVPRVGGYQVSSLLRRHVIFARHDMMRDVAFRRLDLVSCRNVLIYFKPEAQKLVMTSLERSLIEGGVLVLGQSEGVGGHGQQLTPIDARSHIFRKRGDQDGGVAPVRPLPTSLPQFVGVHPSVNRGGPLADSDLIASYDLLLQRFIKAGALIDRHGEILHNFGKIDRYIRLPVGRMRNNITSLIRPELRTPLQAGINRALSERRVITITDAQLGEGESEGKAGEIVEITVEAIPERSNGVQHLLIAIESVRDKTEPLAGEPLTVREGREMLLSRLEAELDDTRGSLRQVMQQLEASNKDLQSSNEELLAGNEELQATNAELQAVNEELHTINSEHFRKIEELEQVNADIENLLGSMTHAILFVDPELCLRRWNAEASTLLGIGPTDLGKQLMDLPERSTTTFIADNCAAIFAGNKLQQVLEVEGRRYLVQMIGAKGANGNSDGVLVAFTDTTEIVGLAQRAEVAEATLGRALESLPHPAALFDADGRLTMLNEAFASMYEPIHEHLRIGLSYEECVRAVAEHGMAPEALGRLEDWVAERAAAARERRSVDTVLMRAGRWYRIIDHPIPDGGTLAMRFLIKESNESATDQAAVDPAASRRLAMLESLFEHGTSAKFLVDRTAKLITGNVAFAQLVGQVGDELMGGDLDTTPALRDSGIGALVQTVLRTGEPVLDCSFVLRSGATTSESKPYRIRLLPVEVDRQVVGVSAIIQPAESERAPLFGALPGLLKVLECERAGLAFLDRLTRFVEVGNDMAVIDGVPIEAHKGKTIKEVLPAAKALLAICCRDVIAKGEPIWSQRIEMVLPSHPETPKPYEVSLVPQRNAKGKIEGAHLVLVPMEPKKKAPSAARRAKRG